MPEFYAEIIETLIKGVTVEAESADEAERIVEERYANSDIVLTADDFFDWEIVVSKVGGADV